MKKIFFVALALWSAAAAPAAADGISSDTDFRGVVSVRVTVSPMSVESIDCNLDGDTLTRELQHQLDAEGLAASTSVDTLAVITILSSREAGSGPCTSAVMLGAYKKASFFDDQAKWLRTGYVVIWQSALLFSSTAETHMTLARDSVQRLGKALLTEWRRANSVKPSAEQ